MKDKELAKALEAVLEAGDSIAHPFPTNEQLCNWEDVAETARGLLKNRQDRADRAKRNHVSKQRRDD